MLLKNAKLYGKAGRWNISIKDEKILVSPLSPLRIL